MLKVKKKKILHFIFSTCWKPPSPPSLILSWKNLKFKITQLFAWDFLCIISAWIDDSIKFLNKKILD